MKEVEDVLITAMKPKSVSRIDGIKLNFNDGWLLVRASGTEPKIRITAEARTKKETQELYAGAEKLVKDFAYGSGKN